MPIHFQFVLGQPAAEELGVIRCIKLLLILLLWTEVVLLVLQGWCVQSSDPRTLGINSVPKEVIPGQVNFPDVIKNHKISAKKKKRSSTCIFQTTSSLCALSGCPANSFNKLLWWPAVNKICSSFLHHFVRSLAKYTTNVRENSFWSGATLGI